MILALGADGTRPAKPILAEWRYGCGGSQAATGPMIRLFFREKDGYYWGRWLG